eukprot:CAMPEP_0196999510 /NCGR_PEP_ID=MMETSP1380-20130617/4664_1 /TAXON_ID=5936 /ORGANISM="Euplotes crassus, Strain CT5" /LENGTH=258 /DNA_ID=CAMNT_0042416453 /DNA_START=185 /DNA_END=961 /DNA_ORIENTATION=-
MGDANLGRTQDGGPLRSYFPDSQRELPYLNSQCIDLLNSSNQAPSLGAHDFAAPRAFQFNNLVDPNHKSGTNIISSQIVQKRPNPEGFRLLTYKEKSRLFGGKRDDLFYKTFVRDIRKFWEDGLVEYNTCSMDKKDKKGVQFYKLLQQYERSLGLSEGETFSSEEMVCYLGSLINHREFIKACPKKLKNLSDNIHYVFTKFTKERLYKLCKTPQFRILFKKYAEKVNKENDYERLKTHRTIGANLAPYMVIYKELIRV